MAAKYPVTRAAPDWTAFARATEAGVMARGVHLMMLKAAWAITWVDDWVDDWVDASGAAWVDGGVDGGVDASGAVLGVVWVVATQCLAPREGA